MPLRPLRRHCRRALNLNASMPQMASEGFATFLWPKVYGRRLKVVHAWRCLAAPKGRLIVLLVSWPTVTRNACSASAPMGPSRSTTASQSRRHSQEATRSASGAETEAQEEVASHHRTSIPPAWTGLSSCFPVCFGLLCPVAKCLED